MKKIYVKRAMLFALCLCCLFGICRLSAAAAELPPTDSVTAPIVGSDAPAEGESEAQPENGAPLSAEISSLIKESAPTVLSAASLLVMTAIALFFKKGVLPKLLSLFETLFKKSGETLSSLSECERAAEERLSSLLARGEEVFAAAEGIKSTEGALRASLLKNQTANECFSTLFREQSDLLFELLMSANLPQYQKDRVASVYQKAMHRLDTLAPKSAEDLPVSEREG